MDYQIFIYDLEELRISDYFGRIWQLMGKKIIEIIEIKVIKNQLMFIYMWKILKLLKLQLLEF